jgi:septum formation protein
VYTGVSIVMKKLGGDFHVKSFSEVTDVQMAKVSDNVLKSYIESGEPLDKAGGYGIQGLGCSLISSINGDYFNVMGFPAHKFAAEFLNFINNNLE